ESRTREMAPHFPCRDEISKAATARRRPSRRTSRPCPLPQVSQDIDILDVGRSPTSLLSPAGTPAAGNKDSGAGYPDWWQRVVVSGKALAPRARTQVWIGELAASALMTARSVCADRCRSRSEDCLPPPLPRLLPWV